MPVVLREETNYDYIPLMAVLIALACICLVILYLKCTKVKIIRPPKPDNQEVNDKELFKPVERSLNENRNRSEYE